jgi:hypothetical protein
MAIATFVRVIIIIDFSGLNCILFLPMSRKNFQYIKVARHLPNVSSKFYQTECDSITKMTDSISV